MKLQENLVRHFRHVIYSTIRSWYKEQKFCHENLGYQVLKAEVSNTKGRYLLAIIIPFVTFKHRITEGDT